MNLNFKHQKKTPKTILKIELLQIVGNITVKVRGAMKKSAKVSVFTK